MSSDFEALRARAYRVVAEGEVVQDIDRQTIDLVTRTEGLVECIRSGADDGEVLAAWSDALPFLHLRFREDLARVGLAD